MVEVRRPLSPWWEPRANTTHAGRRWTKKTWEGAVPPEQETAQARVVAADTAAIQRTQLGADGNGSVAPSAETKESAMCQPYRVCVSVG